MREKLNDILLIAAVIVVVIIIALVSFHIGCTRSMEIIQDNRRYIEITDSFKNDYVNMNDVSDFESNGDRIILYTKNGDAYTWSKSVNGND